MRWCGTLGGAAVKRDFGTWITRLMRGGCRLTDGEHLVLTQLVEHVDPSIKSVVDAQFEEYNLVQREVDGRALNFYKIVRGKKGLSDALLLFMDRDEATLVRISLDIPGTSEVLHATLTAVNGRVFCASFSQPVPAKFATDQVELRRVVRSPLSKDSTAQRAAQQPHAAIRDDSHGGQY